MIYLWNKCLAAFIPTYLKIWLNMMVSVANTKCWNFNSKCNESPSTACWRGYVGTWQIEDDKLFLIEFKGYVENRVEVAIDYIFPDQAKVFAGWHTGEIKIPQGKMLHYEHMGYMSIFEKDLFFEFNNGILAATREVDNTKTFNPEDPMGWNKVQRELYEYFSKNLKKGKPSSPDEQNSD